MNTTKSNTTTQWHSRETCGSKLVKNGQLPTQLATQHAKFHDVFVGFYRTYLQSQLNFLFTTPIIMISAHGTNSQNAHYFANFQN